MASAWTLEEDQALRALWMASGSIAANAHMVPGRTIAAIKKRAALLSLGFRTNQVERLWRPEEDAVIREAWNQPGAMKLLTAKLPDRSTGSILQRSRRLGLTGARGSLRAPKYSWCLQVIEDALRKHQPLTARQIAACTDASYERAGQILGKYRGDRFHVEGWIRESAFGCWSARWALGDGEDAPRPPRRATSDVAREWRKRAKLRAARGNPFASMIQQVSS
jgi:hypothetical protein